MTLREIINSKKGEYSPIGDLVETILSDGNFPKKAYDEDILDYLENITYGQGSEKAFFKLKQLISPFNTGYIQFDLDESNPSYPNSEGNDFDETVFVENHNLLKLVIDTKPTLPFLVKLDDLRGCSSTISIAPDVSKKSIYIPAYFKNKRFRVEIINAPNSSPLAGKFVLSCDSVTPEHSSKFQTEPYSNEIT